MKGTMKKHGSTILRLSDSEMPWGRQRGELFTAAFDDCIHSQIFVIAFCDRLDFFSYMPVAMLQLFSGYRSLFESPLTSRAAETFTVSHLNSALDKTDVRSFACGGVVGWGEVGGPFGFWAQLQMAHLQMERFSIMSTLFYIQIFRRGLDR